MGTMWQISIFIFSIFIRKSFQQSGSEIAPCVWQNSDGTIVDLNGIGRTDGTPRWSNAEPIDPEADSQLYFLNPCHGFSLGSTCQNAVACVTTDLESSYLKIGDQSRGRMYSEHEGDGSIILEYSSNIGSNEFVSRFVIACTEEDHREMIVYGSQLSTLYTTIYRFLLLTPCACPNGCVEGTTKPLVGAPAVKATDVLINTRTTQPFTITHVPINTQTRPPYHTIHTLGPVTKPPPSKKGLTPGGIICIVFICCVCAYLLFGAAYMFFFRGAKGVEIIPHVHFWKDVPILVVEGISFVCSCCQVTESIVVKSDPDYNKI